MKTNRLDSRGIVGEVCEEDSSKAFMFPLQSIASFAILRSCATRWCREAAAHKQRIKALLLLEGIELSHGACR